MNILVIAGEAPATSEMPGSPRLWSLCRELARHHQLFLMARGESDERWRWFREHAETPKVFAEVIRLPDPPPATWAGKQRHRIQLASHFCTRYLTPDYHGRLSDVIGAEIAAKRAGLVYVDSLAMTQYLDGRSGVPMAADLHDCSTLLYRRMAGHERHWRRKLALYLETWSIARWERSLANRFDVVITNSSVDEVALRRLMPGGRVVTIPNGVDCDYFASAAAPTGSRRIVFTGVMNYGPNADAAKYCAEEIFPRVREKVPDAEFWVVGADPDAAVRRLGEREGVHVTGRVADIRPHLSGAAVSVCPVRFGAGIKNKILAAMAMAKPVVSTGVGLEGVEARPGEDVLRADTPQEFADGIASVLTSESLARRLGENGYRLVKERYSWQARAESLERTLGIGRASPSMAGTAGG